MVRLQNGKGTRVSFILFPCSLVASICGAAACYVDADAGDDGNGSRRGLGDRELCL